MSVKTFCQFPLRSAHCSVGALLGTDDDGLLGNADGIDDGCALGALLGVLLGKADGIDVLLGSIFMQTGTSLLLATLSSSRLK